MMKLIGLTLCLVLAVVVYEINGLTFTAAWDDVVTCVDGNPCTADHYEATLIRDGDGHEYGPYSTSTNFIVLVKPRSGEYQVKVRAIATGHDPGQWCYSTDISCAQLKDRTAGGWKALWRPSPIVPPITVTPEGE
jgi:hypothetical protein